MRKTLLSLALMFSVGCAVAAPPTPESIERLLTLTRTEALVDGMYAQMEPYLREVMRSAAPAKVTAAQQKAMDDLAPRLINLLREDLNWKSLKPEYVRIYQETLDQTEVDGMITFYESPVGQSMIGKMPLIVQRSMEMSQSQMKALMPKINRLVEESVKKTLSAQ